MPCRGPPSRRALLRALALTAAAAGSPLSAREPRLSFVALGDWGRRGAARQRAVAGAMATAAEAAGSRFVISAGDNFYESGVQSVTDTQWKTSFEDVYTAPSLQTPWYTVLGNHDHRGSAQAQVDYSRVSPRWRMPSRYYAVSGAQHGAPHLDLFFLDTTALVAGYGPASPPALQRAATAQLDWLDAELGRSRAAWKLVVGHHPVHSGGSQHGDTPALLAKVNQGPKRPTHAAGLAPDRRIRMARAEPCHRSFSRAAWSLMAQRARPAILARGDPVTPQPGNSLKRRLIEQAELPGPHHRLDACADAQESAGLFQVLLDCALGDPEDLAGIARTLARFSPAQAFELTTTEDHQIPPYRGGRHFKLKHTHDAPRACNSREMLPQEI